MKVLAEINLGESHSQTHQLCSLTTMEHHTNSRSRWPHQSDGF